MADWIIVISCNLSLILHSEYCSILKALVAKAMVSNQLDYCNPLLYGVCRASVAKLQETQNGLCHIVFRLVRMSHVTTYLEQLLWLPISYCILFQKQPLFQSHKFLIISFLSYLIKSDSEIDYQVLCGLAYDFALVFRLSLCGCKSIRGSSSIHKCFHCIIFLFE